MDDELLTSIGLASDGYAGGDPEAVMALPIGTVLGMVHYSTFRQQFLETAQWMAHQERKEK